MPATHAQETGTRNLHEKFDASSSQFLAPSPKQIGQLHSSLNRLNRRRCRLNLSFLVNNIHVVMVNSPGCCTSLFSSQLTLALTLCANSESSRSCHRCSTI